MILSEVLQAVTIFMFIQEAQLSQRYSATLHWHVLICSSMVEYMAMSRSLFKSVMTDPNKTRKLNLIVVFATLPYLIVYSLSIINSGLVNLIQERLGKMALLIT